MGEYKFEKWAFNDEKLKTEAITHKSYAAENPGNGPHNERLEWIGDSIITTVVSDYLFLNFQDRNEGSLTNLRSKIVCKETLAKFARKLELDNELLLGKGTMGDRNNDRLLEDTFEAYIGAIYLDSGRNLNDVIKFMEPIIKPYVEEMAANDLNNNVSSAKDSEPVYGPMNKQIESGDPIGMLQSWAQSRAFQIPEYKYTEIPLADNKIDFECEVIIEGKSYGVASSGKKKDARKKSSIIALESLGITNYNP
ncbi:23996_t:CDS:1 [Dentiscutata erythropus]|uniref:ribonuclease III n=1 Tax=Dentiscutata erythropus TaxID=1348616 RepID=A0A9N8VP59_9GLOM|nr:23996_t:CDS:1 [Dentiscutata erythropus]